MTELQWVLKDPEGNTIRASESFETRDEAEAWMGAEWASLLEEGAETVVLMDGDGVVYEMGLREA